MPAFTIPSLDSPFDRFLTPEEDAIGDPDDEDDEIDDTLPADLWFRAARRSRRAVARFAVYSPVS